jgi:anti-anti-sigma factor
MPHLEFASAYRGGAPMPTPFRCEVIPERDRVRVAPAGELDIATASQLEQVILELLEAGFRHVVLDLAGLEFVDSTGLQLILRLQGSADAGEFAFEVRPGPPAVQRLFALTGTLDLVRFDGAPRRLPAHR